jgi:steroid 5-alpha reductase family enzyme
MSVMVIYFTLFFNISTIKKNYGLIDIAWGLGFVVIVWFHYFNSSITMTVFHQVLTGLVTIWGLRLTYHLTVRNWNKPEDFRYTNMRQNMKHFFHIQAYFKFFMLQMVFMLIISMPFHIFYYHMAFSTPFNWMVLIIALIIYAIGFYFESAGDAQLKAFKQNPNNKGHIMTKGVWSWTRHPNHFGDFMVWWGFFILTLTSTNAWILLTIIGPLFMSFLLRYVSGVPLLEKKYKDNEAYQNYAKTTPIFIPKRPRKEA